MAKKDEEKRETDGAATETADSPLLDLSDAAVKRMIKTAKKRGFVTHDELNAVLPSEEEIVRLVRATVEHQMFGRRQDSYDIDRIEFLAAAMTSASTMAVVCSASSSSSV